jgi:hypothetical protein
MKGVEQGVRRQILTYANSRTGTKEKKVNMAKNV